MDSGIVADCPSEALRILIVEDDDDARENLRDILELHNHCVTTEASFSAALEIENLASFDVIILDRKFPEGMVEERLPTFRERARNAELIVVTAYADMYASIAALREGVTDYIIKPIDSGALLRTLQRISRRREIERELQKEQQFAEMVLQTAEAIILVLDRDGRIARFNEYLAELTGHTLDEVEDHDWFETFIPEHHRERVRHVFEQTISHLETRGVLNPILTKSGEEKEIRWSNTVVRDRTGSVTGVLAVGLDVTDLVNAQQQIRQNDRLAAIGQTMTGVAHESRNALQRIQNSVELLEDELEGNSEAIRYVGKISRAANDMRDLLEEVRAYAAPIKLDLAIASLPSVWRRAWESLENNRRQAVLVESSDDSLPATANVDRRRIEQVFRNLFENSFDACGDDVEVCISYEITDKFVTISVRDDGPGMPQEVRAHVFDAFYSTKPTGTGLGMAIAERIVESHRGTIELTDSTSGTEFVIRLPIALDPNPSQHVGDAGHDRC